MSNSYRVEIETKKNIESKEEFIEFYKKILSLKRFVDKLSFEYNDEADFEAIYGSLVLNKEKLSSLCKSESIRKRMYNLDVSDKIEGYILNYCMFKHKNSKKIQIVIEDASEELYEFHTHRTFSWLWVHYEHKNIKWLKFKLPGFYFSIPTYKRWKRRYFRLPGLVLPSWSITLDPTIVPYKKINKFVKENNEEFLEFVKAVISLYDTQISSGGSYNDTVCEITYPTFYYGKIPKEISKKYLKDLWLWDSRRGELAKKDYGKTPDELTKNEKDKITEDIRKEQELAIEEVERISDDELKNRHPFKGSNVSSLNNGLFVQLHSYLQ